LNHQEFIFLIESFSAFRDLKEICEYRGLSALILGVEDLMSTTELLNEEAGDWLRMIRANFSIAARAKSIAAIDEGLSLGMNGEEINSAIENSRRMGFCGMVTIHPSQITAVEKGFRPSALARNWASKVLQRPASVEVDSGYSRSNGLILSPPNIRRALSIRDAIGPSS
jgi:citrate lyase subunit beta/citryl-CoA lyase